MWRFFKFIIDLLYFYLFFFFYFHYISLDGKSLKEEECDDGNYINGDGCD